MRSGAEAPPEAPGSANNLARPYEPEPESCTAPVDHPPNAVVNRPFPDLECDRPVKNVKGERERDWGGPPAAARDVGAREEGWGVKSQLQWGKASLILIVFIFPLFLVLVDQSPSPASFLGAHFDSPRLSVLQCQREPPPSKPSSHKVSAIDRVVFWQPECQREKLRQDPWRYQQWNGLESI